MIRHYLETDRLATDEVHLAAFGPVEGPEIVRLIHGLAQDLTAQPSLSLVAVVQERVVGHIVFTSARLNEVAEPVRASILAPLAVAPEFQRQGIGAALVRDGIARLTANGVDLVFVLGSPDYYARFGFEPALPRGLDAPYSLPAAWHSAWMALDLSGHVLGTVRGVLGVADTLQDPRYWRE